jgi:hypothetical protein
LFCREFIDKQRLRVNVYLYDGSRPLSSFESSRTRDELRQRGFDGYVLDYIQGPDEVLAVLCQRNRLHEIPVAHKDIRDHDGAQSVFNQYIAAKTAFSTKRAYGGSSTRSTRIGGGQMFARTIDTERQSRLEQAYEELSAKCEDHNRRVEAIKEKDTRLREKDAAIRRDYERLKAEKKSMLDRKKDYEKKKQLLGEFLRFYSYLQLFCN